MIVLALDTSTAEGSVAVLERERVLASRKWARRGSHSELLTAEIENCLRDSGLAVSKLQALALGNGPGSFTGIRVAVNAARSLAYSLSIPVYVYDTTEILAEGISHSDLPVVALVNAQKNAVFASTFSKSKNEWVRMTSPSMVEVGGLEALVKTRHLCVGDGYEALAPLLTPTLVANLVRDPSMSDFPSAEMLGKMAWNRRTERKPLVWKDVQALYIRASGAEEMLKK